MWSAITHRVAEYMLPHLAGRPLTLHRFPDGIGADGFFQQSHAEYFGDWVGTLLVRHEESTGSLRHILCEDADCPAFLADQAAITFYCWAAHRSNIDCPDLLIFDLDPPGDDVGLLKRTARRVVAVRLPTRSVRDDYRVVRSARGRALAIAGLFRRCASTGLSAGRAGGGLLPRGAHHRTAARIERWPALSGRDTQRLRPDRRGAVPPCAPARVSRWRCHWTGPSSTRAGCGRTATRWRMSSVGWGRKGDPWAGLFEQAGDLTAAREALDRLGWVGVGLNPELVAEPVGTRASRHPG